MEILWKTNKEDRKKEVGGGDSRVFIRRPIWISVDRYVYVYRQFWQSESQSFTPSRWECRVMDPRMYTLPIEATAGFSVHLIFKASSVLNAYTITHALVHIFSQPLSHKCQYKKKCWHISLSLCRRLSLFCSFLLVKRDCLSKLLEDIVNHFSKRYHLLFFTWCANWCKGKGGGRWGGMERDNHQTINHSKVAHTDK